MEQITEPPPKMLYLHRLFLNLFPKKGVRIKQLHLNALRLNNIHFHMGSLHLLEGEMSAPRSLLFRFMVNDTAFAFCCADANGSHLWRNT